MERSNRRIEGAPRHHHKEDYTPEYRIYKRSLYEGDDLKRDEVVGARIDKHIKGKHRDLRNCTKDHSEDTESEEGNEYNKLRHFVPEKRHGPKENTFHKHRQPKQYREYSSVSDLREHNYHEENRHFPHHIPKILFRRTGDLILSNNTQSEHDSSITYTRKHLPHNLGCSTKFVRSPQISEGFSRYQQKNNIGDSEGGGLGPKSCHNHRFCDQRSGLDHIKGNTNSPCCKRPEVCTNCLDCKRSTSRKNDQLNEVIEKLKSDFVIAPKPKELLSSGAKGVYIYVPLSDENDSKEIIEHLDRVHKNSHTNDNLPSETSRRKRELKKIVDKYTYPERAKESNSIRAVEEKIHCETFFKKCDTEGIPTETSFKTTARRGSVKDILDDICRLPIRESKSEFLAKFEDKLRRAIHRREENCYCLTSSRKNLSEDHIDRYIDDLIGVLKHH